MISSESDLMGQDKARDAVQPDLGPVPEKPAAGPPLKTKLYVPGLPQAVVMRPRLAAQIEAGTQRGLCLISAPAGFGKTTALAEWAAQNQARLAWVSLDAGDNDLRRFFTYLLFSLEMAGATGPDSAALRAEIGALPPRTLLEALIGDLESNQEPFVLVLDDYHVITAQPIHEALTFLLDHCPPSMRLVIATRSDPPIPLARWRARGRLGELRQNELRFTPEETAAFLNQVMGLPLEPEAITLLETRTEGWIAGLQLAALSMQGRQDIAGFLRAFSGSHRFILDYLVEEVINRQPAEIQAFLLHTSILDRLCGPLCDKVLENGESRMESGQVSDSPLSTLGSHSSQSTLEYLERANLFLVPLDDERRWYRYHHLFAELLRARLRQFSPGLIPGLHRRASAWLDQNGFPIEALQHALAAQDYDGAARLIQQHGHERWSASDLSFMTFLSQLPVEMLETRPNLGIYRVWMLLIYGQIEAAQALLERLVQHLPTTSDDPELEGIRGFCELISSYTGILTRQEIDLRLPDRRALEFIPEEFLAMRNSAEVVYARLLIYAGDFDQAEELLRNAVRRDLAAGGTTAIPICIATLARMRIVQGRLGEAAGLCREYLKMVTERDRRRFYNSGDLNIALAEVLFEWDELKAAEAEARTGIEANEPWNIPIATVMGYTVLARLQRTGGDLEGASASLERAEKAVAGRRIPPEGFSELYGQRLRLGRERGDLIARGDLAAAREWLSRLPASYSPLFLWELDNLNRARFLMDEREYTQALELLDKLAAGAEAGKRACRSIQIGLLRALVLQALGQLPQAYAQLKLCLDLAEPEGYVRTFLEEGEPALELLTACARHTGGAHSAYIQRLLSAFHGGSIAEAARPYQGKLVEPLTPRELEVLRCLSAGDSNGEIAAKLFISVSAVKKHTGSIYGKLGVASRTQAVARGRQLGLLP
jgi:LuxR family maltose regulon positive regulatory protein